MALRVPEISPAEATDEQKELMAQISGPRFGILPGPFKFWIRTPDLARHVNGMGNALRDGGKLNRQLYEVAVLTTAHWCGAGYMWDGHMPQALNYGLSQQAIDSIAAGDVSRTLSNDQQLIHALTLELLETRTWSVESFEKGRALLGVDDLVELVGTIGFYQMGAISLNAFGIGPLSEADKRKIAEAVAKKAG